MEITVAVKDGNRENNFDYEKLQGTAGEKSLQLKRQYFSGYEKQQRREAKQKRRQKDGLGRENNFTAETVYGQIFKTSVI